MEIKTGEYEKRKEKFLEGQNSFNSKIDAMKESYLNLNVDSIVQYCEIVLNNSQYPECFTTNFELEYNPGNKKLNS